MRYGKISAALLIIAGATFVLLFLCQPGWGNPLAILGGLLVMFSFPAALVFGIIGIIYDNNKWLAIISTLLSGGLILFWFYKIGM